MTIKIIKIKKSNITLQFKTSRHRKDLKINFLFF